MYLEDDNGRTYCMFKIRKNKNRILVWLMMVALLLPLTMGTVFAETVYTEPEPLNKTAISEVDKKNEEAMNEAMEKIKALAENENSAQGNDPEFVTLYTTLENIALGSDAAKMETRGDGGGSYVVWTYESDFTIEYGYDVIDSIVKGVEQPWISLSATKPGYPNATIQAISTNWKNSFYNKAMQYGLPVNSYIGEQIDKHTESLGILRWGDVTPKQSGSIQGLITRIYSFQSGDVSANLANFVAAVKGIGMALCVAFAIATMTTMATERNMSSEALTKEFAKLIFGIWLIANFQWIAASIIRLGTIIFEAITMEGAQQANPYFQFKRALYESFYETAKAFNFKAAQEVSASGVTVKVVSANSKFHDWLLDALNGGLVNLIASMSVYAVAIELGIRYVFTPIAIADMFSEKMRSTGVRYLKELLACAMTGAVMYFIVYVAYQLRNVVQAGTIATIAIDLTMVGMMARARNISSSIVGS